MSSKKFAYIFILIFIGLVLLVSTLNYVVNPVGAFNTKFFPKKIDQSRKSKAEKINDISEDVDLVYIGSSRIKNTVSEKDFKIHGLTAYNYAFTQTGVEDYYCQIKYMLEKTDVKPKTVVISLDFLNFRPRPPHISLSLTPQYQEYLKDNSHNRFMDFLSLDITKLSINVLLNPPSKEILDKPDKSIATFKYDASRVSKKIEAMKSRTYAGYNDVISIKRWYFEELLKCLQENDVKVIVILLPYHPRHLKMVKEHPIFSKSYNSYQDLIWEMQSKYEFDLLNYTDPNILGIDTCSFIDPIHLRSDAGGIIVEKIIEKIDN